MTQTSKSEFITFMKGVAITGIVLYHLIADFLSVPQFLKTASGFGGAGVHIFFFCSGFGLYLSHLRRPLRFLPFLKKRGLKIYVPYIVVVLLSFCVPAMYSGNDRITALLSHVFLFKMFIPRFEESFGSQLWYLSTIFQFYFSFLALVKIKEKIGAGHFLILSCAVSFLWASFTAFAGLGGERIWNSFFLQYLWEFALGMYAAEKYRENSLSFTRFKLFPVAAATLLSFLIYTAMALKGGIWRSFNDVFSAAAFGGGCLILYRVGLFGKLFRMISTISYEWYLLHILVFTVIYELPGRLSVNLTGFIAFICSILCAFLYQKSTAFVQTHL